MSSLADIIHDIGKFRHAFPAVAIGMGLGAVKMDEIPFSEEIFLAAVTQNHFPSRHQKIFMRIHAMPFGSVFLMCIQFAVEKLKIARRVGCIVMVGTIAVILRNNAFLFSNQQRRINLLINQLCIGNL